MIKGTRVSVYSKPLTITFELTQETYTFEKAYILIDFSPER